MKILAWIYLVVIAIAAVYGVYMMYIIDRKFFNCFALAVIIMAAIIVFLWITLSALDKIRE